MARFIPLQDAKCFQGCRSSLWGSQSSACCPSLHSARRNLVQDIGSPASYCANWTRPNKCGPVEHSGFSCCFQCNKYVCQTIDLIAGYADVQAVAICLCSGSILIFAIFLKYVTVQIKRSSVRCVDTELDSVPSNYGIVHEWGLILRFVIAFLGTRWVCCLKDVSAALTRHSALELAMILIQISIAERNKTVFTGEPDFSVESAKLDFVLFMPGVSASLICFAVFGTTKTYVDYLSRLLMPIHVFKKTQGGGQRVTVSIA